MQHDVFPTAVAVLGVPDLGAPLTRAQKRFNHLIARLKVQRNELATWQAFQRVYHQRLADEYLPLTEQLRERRVALAHLLDRALAGNLLGKRDANQARGMLCRLLGTLLADRVEPELVKLHDKYAAASFGEEQQNEMEALRTLAEDTFGVDVRGYHGSESPEELADWIDDQIHSTRRRPRKASKRNKDAAADAGGNFAVRDVYRKLVSELHPDRESDPAEQARKTVLMQRVNQAYKAGDLLGLLELQLSIEQIDATTLSGLPAERLGRYLHVLEEQSDRLRDELATLVAPFKLAVGETRAHKLTPAAVTRALNADIREMAGLLRAVEAELTSFQDIRLLRQSLRQCGIRSQDGADA